MSLTTVMAIALGLSLTVYAIFAGADFGAGVLDLTSGPRREQRRALARTIGPLWEANHVWLIFSITILFSTFPPAFAALGTVMLAPFTLAVMAIVVRGAALDYGATRPGRRPGTSCWASRSAPRASPLRSSSALPPPPWRRSRRPPASVRRPRRCRGRGSSP
jgi:cytochrome d ubiquinol oxidase subunit II